MIGDGWAGEPATRPGEYDEPDRPRSVAIVTGSRADFALLEPVIGACNEHPMLEAMVIVCGSHLVGPTLTYREVARRFEVCDKVPMQVAGRTGRAADVEALGRGIQRLGRSLERLGPDWVLVLGDRIEALAGAASASVGGFALAHIHGGDRAEGVSDEGIRHAITKLAHLHLPATEHSASRINKRGERPRSIHVVGSPALDGLDEIPAMNDRAFADLGSPQLVVLMHPVGRTNEGEEAIATGVLSACDDRRTLALMPNLDPGRVGVVRAIKAWAGQPGRQLCHHMPRADFIGLLRRLAFEGGVLVGNSSAGLIEAAAVRLPSVDVGQRQLGRERPDSVVHVDREDPEAIARAIDTARSLDRAALTHPFGDGHAGERTAQALAQIDPHSISLLRKCNTY